MKMGFWDIYLSTSLAVRNFGNSYGLRTIVFFLKYSKLYLGFKNAEKKWENCFCFLDIWIWVSFVKLSLLRREYWSRVVNALSNSPKIFCITKRDFLQFNLTDSDQYMWWRCYCADYNSVWDCLPCYMSKGLVKRCFLGICRRTSFTASNFENI